MRLVCPNCGAQYEVDDRVIPESGRDVQCSACGHAWYQMPLGHPEPEDDQPAPDHDETLAPEDDDDEDAQAQGAEGEPTEHDEPEAASEAPTQRREIDDDVRSILREEAERELSRRAAEHVETQPDLGLDSSPSPEEERRRIARERMARMRGVDDEPEVEASEPIPEHEAEPKRPRAPRRELFPDIEEINSTLDGHGMAEGDASDGDGRPRSGGFGRGFFLVIFLAALLLTVYLLAPKLAETIPGSEPALTSYVDAVNAGRAWLDGAMQAMIARIESMAGGE